jgi:hypothetical protein
MFFSPLLLFALLSQVQAHEVTTSSTIASWKAAIGDGTIVKEDVNTASARSGYEIRRRVVKENTDDSDHHDNGGEEDRDLESASEDGIESAGEDGIESASEDGIESASEDGIESTGEDDSGDDIEDNSSNSSGMFSIRGMINK